MEAKLLFDFSCHEVLNYLFIYLFHSWSVIIWFAVSTENTFALEN